MNMPANFSDPISVGCHTLLECDTLLVFGERALRIQIERVDGQPMAYRELWDVFDARYAGRWAIQAFPPRAYLLDEANKYHLFVFDREPPGLNLFRSVRAPKSNPGDRE